MKYKRLKGYKDEDFRQLTGVKKASFEKMVEILKEAESKRKYWEVSPILYRWKIVY